MPDTTAHFYNRSRELDVLADVIRSERSELFIIYGRRGVGKTALLDQAACRSGLRHLYYRATRRTLPLQLAALAAATREAWPGVFLPRAFASTGDFLDLLSHQAEQRHQAGDRTPVLAVIDELPYLADVDPGLLTAVQHWWDDNKRRPNLKLFLAGSYVAFMEREVLDRNAPLYNRRTGAMRLQPMDYAETALFFPRYSAPQKMAAYAVLGGLPLYLEQFDPARSLEENVRATALRRNTFLCEEPDWLLLEDLRRDVTFGSMLRAIAGGARRPSDIARAIGAGSASDMAPRLASLQELGLVVREVPLTDRRQARSRTSLYFLADNYLDFWYRYVDPARSLIARGQGDRLWAETIGPTLDEYVSRPAFERACRQYLWRALTADALPPGVHFTDVGTWWGQGDLELDVVAVDEHDRVTLAGSCKWRTRALDVADYADLLQTLGRSGLQQTDPHLALFARSGFTRRLRELAVAQDPQRLLLVDLDDMYEV